MMATLQKSNAIRRDSAWSIYARSYDQVLPRLSFYKTAVERHCEAMGQPSIREVVDVGAGTGNVTARLLQAGHFVTAVDSSSDMLQMLRAKVDTPNMVERLSVIHESAESMPRLEDKSVDGVTILLALYAIAHPVHVLKEVKRILRDGGTVVITEPRSTFELKPLLEAGEKELRALPEWPELESRWSDVTTANLELDPRIACDRRIWAEEIAEWLGHNGFTIAKQMPSHLGQCSTIVATKLPKG